jgi:hypothetical protein
MNMRQRAQRREADIGWSAAVALGLVLLGGALTRGDGQEDLAPQRVHVELNVLATWAGLPTFPSGTRAGDLAVGETQVWSQVVSLECDPATGAAGCRTNVSMPAVPDGRVPEQAVHVWEGRLTVRAASLERIDLDIDWKRYVRGADGQPRVVAGDRRSVQFGEGQRLLLDFVDMRSMPGSESCSSLALELKASVAEDPGLVQRAIDYDLWLVDEGPGGRSANRRWQVTAKHGEARDFEFATLRRSVPIRGAGEGTSARVNTHVSGHVRGRVMSDGSLEVALFANRGDSEEGGSWGVGGAGGKRARVAASETIRLELPAPAEAPRHPGEAVEEIDHDGKVLAALRERTVSLVLTARPVE